MPVGFVFGLATTVVGVSVAIGTIICGLFAARIDWVMRGAGHLLLTMVILAVAQFLAGGF